MKKEKKIDTSLLDRAICFAVQAHAGLERKGKGFPYIVHPMEAMAIVATMTSDQELLAAAALHDTVEDTDVTVAELQELFGERVALLVAHESDVPLEGDASDTWHDRKTFAINLLKGAERDVKVVAMGDKLSNIRAIARDYAVIGDEIWNLFNVKDKAEHAWHYHGLADALSDLSDTPAYQEFYALVKSVFG
ncbi:MAG: bifunctional (p)ppGpp synthetase/guanosine-3',5'-bis(diphosphate) 3'-pyrophosphohydrolase [Bacteroidaceae bacterium]|nr:bifunctional (p)ppGpp synthetase/guanosine-3',5'-bis(diphosphate) 3'-pyrophosphohydrolase [Bacteroidaceae bacterium]MBQ9883042.1 bifunctional (p)ppGpp synthetase/guanosine-3',5'-bis(diphosphate) 3'-pyrophosphohydrolase [Bacteroidaceae bacterium]